MAEQTTIFDIMRIIFFWISPFVFLVGLCLLLISPDKYNKLESKLGREIGGIRKRIILAIETNIDTFHKWLMRRKTILGLICVVCSIVFFFLFKK